MNAYNSDTEEIKKILREAEHAVFFGGAGVSTESGIPDFRGNGGLYAGEGSSEYYLSRECLVCEPERFFEFFRRNMIFDSAEPNLAHLALAELERRGVIRAVITQNIDGLHQRAGSRNVIELHGTAGRFYCMKCRAEYGADIIYGDSIPRCEKCGGTVRPDVTLYGEPLDGYSFRRAEEEIERADVLIVGGTSLLVNPAASLVDEYQGEHLIIINYSSTPYDEYAEYVIRESVSDVLSAIAEDI